MPRASPGSRRNDGDSGTAITHYRNRQRSRWKPPVEMNYFVVGRAGAVGVAVGALDAAGDGFTWVVPGAAPPGATVAAGSGGLTLKSSTSKIRVAFGPISRPAPRSP